MMTFKGTVDRIGFIAGCLISSFAPLFLTMITVLIVLKIAPENETADTIGTLFVLLWYMLATLYWFMNLTQRVRDTGLNPYWTFLIVVPMINLIFLISLAFIRTDTFKKKD